MVETKTVIKKWKGTADTPKSFQLSQVVEEHDIANQHNLEITLTFRAIEDLPEIVEILTAKTPFLLGVTFSRGV